MTPGSAALRLWAHGDEAQGMTTWYCHPTGAAQLTVEPQLASWDRADSTGQVRLANFLTHAEATAAPMLAAVDGPLSVELVVGLPVDLPLASGGRDLDNYLFPLAQRLGPARVAAMFGRKIHGPSYLAISPAHPSKAMVPAQFLARISGSYERKEWKATIRDRLLQTQATTAEAGPVSLNIAITTGSGRNWANIWKPLIDAFGPVLGEDPSRPFHPNDDRIISLGLHHDVSTAVGHDVIIAARWTIV